MDSYPPERQPLCLFPTVGGAAPISAKIEKLADESRCLQFVQMLQSDAEPLMRDIFDGFRIEIVFGNDLADELFLLIRARPPGIAGITVSIGMGRSRRIVRFCSVSVR